MPSDLDNFDYDSTQMTPKGIRLAELIMAGWEIEAAIKICNSEFDEQGDKRDKPSFDA